MMFARGIDGLPILARHPTLDIHHGPPNLVDMGVDMNRRLQRHGLEVADVQCSSDATHETGTSQPVAVSLTSEVQPYSQ